MRTVLTRILTAFLAASTTLSVSATPQVMKKAGGNANRISVTSTVKPQAAKAQDKTKGLVGLNMLQKRTPKSQFSLRSGATSSTLPGKKKIAYASASGLPEMYGSVIFADGWSEDNQPVGLYSVPTMAGESFNMVIDGPDASAGGVLVNGVYWTTNYFQLLGMVIVTVTGYDFESGEEVASYAGEIDNICKGVAVDPTSGMVYAITYNSNGDGFQLATIEYSETAAVTTAIGEFNYNVNSIAFDSTGQLYAIVYNGETVGESFVVTESFLVKINKTNPADYTVVGETGVAPKYLSDSAIDTKTNRMFWAVSDDTAGYMAEIDLTTGAATRILDFPLNEEVVGLVIPAPAAEEGAPAKVTGLAANFADGSMSGTIDFVAPTTLYDGSNGVGELSYTVLCDGESVATGTTAFGATVNAAVTVAESGMHTFVVYCSNAAGNGPKAQIKAFVGKGVPAATTVSAYYADGVANVSWIPVTESADGGYVNPAEVTYTVTRYPEGVVVADGITEASFSEPLAEPESIVSYTYGVKATYSGATSAEAMSNAIVLGSIVPPYTQDFSNSNALDAFTIIDANKDGKTWMVYNGEARMAYNSSLDMDDWLITPPMKLEAGKAYKVSFKAHANSSTFPERIEVKWGDSNTAAGMANVLVEPTVLSSGTAEEFVCFITPQANGTYYVGFHGISDADMFYLYIDDIEIAAGVAATAPAAPTNLVVTPGANGAKTAAISFNAPAVDFAGNALASLEKVELYRGEELIHTFDAPAVGAELTYTDNLPADGDYTYSVAGYNADGKGESTSATVYVGVDFPAAVSEATLTEDAANPGKVTVTWAAVDKDVNGQAIAADAVKYDLYIYDGNSRVLVAGDLTTTSYSYEAVTEGQSFLQYAVFAKTARGEGDGTLTQMLAIGAPVTNFADTFAGGELTYDWGIQRLGDSTGASWTLLGDESGVPSQDGDNGMIAMKASYIDDASRLYSVKISLAGVENPALTFYTYNIVGESGDPDENLVSVCVSAPNANNFVTVMPEATVNDLCGGAEGWAKVTVNLAAYAGQDIQFGIDVVCKGYAYTIFDNFKISSLVDNDLVATGITAPATVKAGADYTVDVTVSNDGAKDAGAYTVELYADNEKVAEKAAEGLESSKTATVSFERTMSALATEPVTYKAIVVYAADEVLNNNETTEVAVAPIVSNLPKVTDLAASIADGGNKLTWSEPDLTAAAPEAITEDFETATGFAKEFGDWTFVDVDGSAVGGFQGTDVPGITPGQTTASFFIWDQTDGLGNQTFTAHSGMKYLAALFRYDDGETDDWAISPELYGGAQTISFFARSYSDAYPEKIEVYYSTGSLNPDDFVLIPGTTVAKVPKDWTQYNVDVPEGAKHFAIRSCAQGSFMLMVDDVTFIPASGAAADLSIVGYDIYRNGEKVNAEPVAECEYTDAAGKAGDVYQVTVIYNKGVSAGSNEAAATSALDELTAGVKVTTAQGTIIVTGAEGLDVTVVAVDGKVLYAAKGDATVAVETGVYVVKAGDKIVKVLVK